MRVAVYRNLNKDMYSVQCREGKLYGKVIAHCDAIDLIDPQFIVRETGRQKVIETRKKNVHAFVVGQLAAASNWQPQYDIGGWPAKMDHDDTMFADFVSYNPYVYKTFVYSGLHGPEPVRSARTAMLDKSGVYAWGVNE